MNAEILSIGTELVLGDIVNTNAQYLSKQLALKGINVFYQSNIGDNPERIIKALSIAVTRSNIIIFTGGLGPTADDITIATVANALKIPLEKNEEAYNDIVKYFESTGRKMPKNNEKQAMLPVGCTVFRNTIGTAPGCALVSGTQCIVFLPGPPSELKAMYENSLSQYLDKYANGIIKSRFVHIYGIGESEIDEKAKELISGVNPTVAPYAKEGFSSLRITAKGNTENEAEEMLQGTVNRITDIFGECIFGFDDDTLESVVVELLKQKGLTLATAESCTAGYISKRITDISGASQVFNMGVSTYSNEAKEKELSVPADLIEKHGAVSKEVAACMAKGVRVKSGADIGVSITGIAGPNSDGTNKPVGLSYIGISDKDGEYVIKSLKSSKKDREYIRFTSASEAINFLRLYLQGLVESIKGVQKFSAVLQTEIDEKTSREEIEKEVYAAFDIKVKQEALRLVKEQNLLSDSLNKENNQEQKEKNNDDNASVGLEDKSALPRKKPFSVVHPSPLFVQSFGEDLQNPEEEEEYVSQAVTLDELKREKQRSRTVTAHPDTPVFYGDTSLEDELLGKEDETIVSQAVSLDDIKAQGKNNKTEKSKEFKFNIVKGEYNPDEDAEFIKMDEALEDYEKELANQMKRSPIKEMLIHKGDSKKEIARKIALYIAIVVFLVAVVNIALYFLDPIISQKKRAVIVEEYHTAEQTAQRGYYGPEINEKFKSLYDKNKDIIGWITIDGTVIDYPVMQSKPENEFYLYKGFDKSYSREGSIFADNTSSIKYKKETKNIMLYGHNMTSTGTMFNKLSAYKNIDFYKKNPNITFDTLYRDGEYQIFAVFLTNSIKSQDNGNFYNYKQTEFSSDEEFAQWINEARTRSLIKTDIQIAYDDEILTLQTCDNAFMSENSKARLIVMARRIKDGESTQTDTSNATENENPKYPQIWYDMHGLVNPFLNGETPTVAAKVERPTTAANTSTSATVSSSTTTNGGTTTPAQTVANSTTVKTTTKAPATTTTTKSKTTTKKQTTTAKTTIKTTTKPTTTLASTTATTEKVEETE